MSDIDIANRALSRIGCLQIGSFDVQTAAVANIAKIYEAVVDSVLGEGRWQCCKTVNPLSRLVPLPERRWAYRFALPSDRLGPPSGYYDDKTCRRPVTLFELSDNEVWTDSAQLWASYQFRAGPSFWPAYLTELMVLALMAEYAGAIREDWSLRDKLRRDAYGPPEYKGESGQMGMAMGLDAQAQKQHEIDGGHNPLITTRYLPGDARNGWDNW